MSFRFAPSVTQISATKLQLAGRPGEDFSLFQNDSGSFALAEFTGDGGDAPDFLLPASFQAPDLTYAGEPVPLPACVEVRIQMAGAGPRTNLMPTVITTGTTRQDLRFRIVNTHPGFETQNLILWVEAATKPLGEHLHVHVVADAEVDVG